MFFTALPVVDDPKTAGLFNYTNPSCDTAYDSHRRSATQVSTMDFKLGQEKGELSFAEKFLGYFVRCAARVLRSSLATV